MSWWREIRKHRVALCVNNLEALFTFFFKLKFLGVLFSYEITERWLFFATNNWVSSWWKRTLVMLWLSILTICSILKLLLHFLFINSSKLSEDVFSLFLQEKMYVNSFFPSVSFSPQDLLFCLHCWHSSDFLRGTEL